MNQKKGGEVRGGSQGVREKGGGGESCEFESEFLPVLFSHRWKREIEKQKKRRRRRRGWGKGEKKKEKEKEKRR